MVAGKDSGLELNADIIMSWDQNAGRSHNIKIDNSSLEMVVEFKYLGTTLTNQILFRKKLRADWSRGILIIIQCRIFCLPVFYPKILRLTF